MHSAHDGQHALSILEDHEMDLLLADLRMPIMDGMELLRAVNRRGLSLGVVVMTGFPSVSSATEALKCGASDYMVKPFRLRDVHDALIVASQKMNAQQQVERLQAAQRFYESANAAKDVTEISALLPQLLRAALLAVKGTAGGVWMRCMDGSWIMSAMEGSSPRLTVVDPNQIQHPLREATRLSLPIIVQTHRRAVLVVVTSESTVAEHLPRLKNLCLGLARAIERAGD